ELKKGIEEDILKRKTDTAQRAFEDAVLEALCEKVEGEIPDCMYDSKAKENVDSFAQRVSQQGLDLDTYLMYMGMDKATFEQQMRERAVNDVKLDLALEKIIAAEEIKPTDEAIAAEYQKMADMYQIELERLKTIVPETTVAGELAKQDAIKLIVDSAVVKPAEEAAPAERPPRKALNNPPGGVPYSKQQSNHFFAEKGTLNHGFSTVYHRTDQSRRALL
ncbi:MAG: hypothetical protein IKD72_08375, partial [Clostridia bacterium]|nr:hypothetical protein [Clostridia bacterium]